MKSPASIFLYCPFLLLSLSHNLLAEEKTNRVETGDGHLTGPRPQMYLSDRLFNLEAVKTASSVSLASKPQEIARDRRFISYDNGTVLDTKTRLIWAAKDSGKGLFEYEAKAFIKNYRGGGYTDWRMPTMDELEVIYDRNSANRHGYHVTRLIDISDGWVWALEGWGYINAFSFSFGLTTDEVASTHSAWSFRTPSLGYRALPVRNDN